MYHPVIGWMRKNLL